jgi:site-specific DNA-methyltransferase (adenine-specific)
LIDKEKGLLENRGKNFRSKDNVSGSVVYNPTHNPAELDDHQPISDEAKRWNGWGTALKPSHEPIIIACKPYSHGHLPTAHLSWPPFKVQKKPARKEKNKGCEDFYWVREWKSTEDWQQVSKEDYQECESANKSSPKALWELGKGNVHPTVKPVEIMTWLIELLPPSTTIICDPFMGSGTTALAAKKTGKEFIGMELDKSSVVIAQARLKAC